MSVIKIEEATKNKKEKLYRRRKAKKKVLQENFFHATKKLKTKFQRSEVQSRAKKVISHVYRNYALQVLTNEKITKNHHRRSPLRTRVLFKGE